MTSYYHNGALFIFFNFCQLWCPIEAQNFIFWWKIWWNYSKS